MARSAPSSRSQLAGRCSLPPPTSTHPAHATKWAGDPADLNAAYDDVWQLLMPVGRLKQETSV